MSRRLMSVVGMCGALALGACGGGDEEGSEPAGEQSTPAEAVKEIGATRASLDQAVGQLRSGDRQAAHDTVAEAYVEHFENVEGPLEKVDPELNEELEEAISQELRRRIKGGAPVRVVSTLVTDIKGDLATAEAKLSRR